jgi:hypothetical protein
MKSFMVMQDLNKFATYTEDVSKIIYTDNTFLIQVVESAFKTVN